MQVYQSNFSSPYAVSEIRSLQRDWFEEQRADVWWMSPPCLPHSQRGHQRDDLDPRSAGLGHVIQMAAQVQPRWIFLENVPEFASSEMARRLTHTWREIGYRLFWLEHCPTQLGWPNLRKRCYLIATFDRFFTWPATQDHSAITPIRLRDLLDTHNTTSSGIPEDLRLDPDVAEKFGSSLSRIDLTRDQSETEDGNPEWAACFGASYGKSLRHAGSYCITQDGWRRFSPTEVARLLGFPEDFRWPENFSTRTRWRLLGNSLSQISVRWLLQQWWHAKSKPQD